MFDPMWFLFSIICSGGFALVIVGMVIFLSEVFNEI
jgi:hypothetical protein